jgi:hypothetical protein
MVQLRVGGEGDRIGVGKPIGDQEKGERGKGTGEGEG